MLVILVAGVLVLAPVKHIRANFESKPAIITGAITPIIIVKPETAEHAFSAAEQAYKADLDRKSRCARIANMFRSTDDPWARQLLSHAGRMEGCKQLL